MKNTISVTVFLVSVFLAACGTNNETPPVVPQDAGPDRTNTLPDVNPVPDTNQGPETTQVPDTTPPLDTTAPSPTLISLVLDAASTSVVVGTNIAITAKAFFGDSSSMEVSSKAAWSVTPATAATITAAGVLTAVSPGTATVQASFGGKVGTLAITVTTTELKLTAITVSAAAALVDMGNTVQLTAMGMYSDGSKLDITKKVIWTSSDVTVATVSTQGVLTAVSAGAVTMKASMDGRDGSVVITVAAPLALSAIVVTAPSTTLDVGATLALVATGIYADGSKKNITTSVTWTSSDATIATVSSAGIVTGVKEGTVTLKAALSGMGGTVALSITVPIALSSVVVTAGASTVTVGGNVQLTANEVYTDGSKKNVTTTAAWVSGTPTVATVDANGLLTAVKAGSVIITATSGGKSGTVILTVTDVPLSTIQVTPAAPSIPAGTTQQFKATGTYADSSKRDITAEVDWTSSTASVATISGAAATKGLATAKAKGTTTITAALGGKSGTVDLIVTDATLTSLVLTPAQPVIAKDTTVTITATGNYSDNTTKDVTALATWTSSAPAVATVSNADGSDGVVGGLTAGTSTITAAYAGQSATVSVKVNDVTLSSLAIRPAGDATLSKGTTLQFTAVGTFSDRSTQDLTTLAAWSSSDATVATVGDGGGKDGLATALKVGQTTITAAFAGRNASLKLTVTPSPLDTITITAPLTTIAKGTSVQFTATGNYKDGSHQDLTVQVTWNSSAIAVATVANDVTDGLVTALTAGATTIKAEINGVSASTVLTVTGATLSSIAVTPATASVVAGKKVTLTATGTFSDGTKQDLSTLVSWTCTDYTVATVSNAHGSQGTVQGLKAGSATIVAAFMNRAGQSALTAIAAQPDHVTIAAPAKIAKGTTAALVAKLVYTDGTESDITATATWTSATAAAATVSSAAGTQGRLTGVAAGSTIVTAVKDTLSAQVTVTVSDTTLSTLVIRPAMPTVAKGASVSLAVTGAFADGSTQDLTIQAVWSSSATTIATFSSAVGSEGKVTGVAAGPTTITATTLSKTATVTLTVTP